MRLQAEVQRLFLAAPAGVRALVVEVSGALRWAGISSVWQAAQVDLQLPPPAIAISGGDACQLWLSLAQPVSLQEAQDFLLALRERYLRAVPPECIRLRPSSDDPLQENEVPPSQVGPERWSAFVASDLAPLFAEEPWLDQPPGSDAQADLLSRVESIGAEAFARARARLTAAAAPAPAVTQKALGADVTQGAATTDARQFLLSVMQDSTVDLRLRVDAAKALLAASEKR
jgi:hypothetical protein